MATSSQPEQLRYELRFPCHTCSCLTIPIKAISQQRSAQIERFPHVVIGVSCQVCGQHDQYINSWVSARARHHAESRDRYIKHGYAVRKDDALRAPFDNELPWASEAPTPLRASYDKPSVYGDWRNRIRVVELPTHQDREDAP